MNPTSKSMLSVLNMIYFSQMMMIVVFSAVVFYLNALGNSSPDPALATIMRYLLCALLPIGIGTGYFIFKQLMNTIPATYTLREKIGKYQTAVLIRTACFELPALLGAASVMMTGDISFLLFTAIILVLMVMLRPSIYTLTTDMNLTPSERAMLENPSSPL
jgi:hypothetical protein